MLLHGVSRRCLLSSKPSMARLPLSPPRMSCLSCKEWHMHFSGGRTWVVRQCMNLVLACSMPGVLRAGNKWDVQEGRKRG
jgi:hypothetical protein